MKQVFAHYEYWEDYQSGMYNTNNIQRKDAKVIAAINLLSDCSLFYETMELLSQEWKICFSVNMTNNQQNRRAWLGAAACMYKFGTPEFLTRVAWNLLDKNVQDAANKTADKFISKFENKNKQSYAKTLFD